MTPDNHPCEIVDIGVVGVDPGPLVGVKDLRQPLDTLSGMGTAQYVVTDLDLLARVLVDIFVHGFLLGVGGRVEVVEVFALFLGEDVQRGGDRKSVV